MVLGLEECSADSRDHGDELENVMLKEEARQSTDTARETWKTGRLTETEPDRWCPGPGAMEDVT